MSIMHCDIGLAACGQTQLHLKPLGFLSSSSCRQLGGHRRLGQRTAFLAGPASPRLVLNRLICRCQSSNGSTSTKESRISTSDIKVERLRKWLKSLNHDDCNLKLKRCAQESSGSGYGAFAGPGGVAKGSVIVKVPRKALMTDETARQCQDIGPLVKKGNLSPWQAMCLHLLYERARGEASFWYPYIAVLPTELELIGTHPMLWPQKMRQEWLEGSPMLEVTEGRLAICREDHEAILLAGAEKLVPGEHGSEPISITETAVQWAATMLLSRSFSLNLQNQKKRARSFVEETVALVPWADMLNHSSAAGRESCLVYDPRSGVATLQAHCTYSEGQQVFDSYGPNCSPSKLLLDYGFVDEENTKYAVDLPASVLGPVNSIANELLLEAVGLPLDGAVFSLTSAGVDESVMAWTRAVVATRQELYDAGWREGVRERAAGYPSAATVMFRFSRPISRDNEDEVLRRLQATCDYLLQKYPTTYEEDVDMLATPGAKAIPWGRKQAMRALMSEKLALKATQQNIQRTLNKLRSGWERGSDANDQSSSCNCNESGF
ncbi:hypothetical protein M758_3G118800 [Ceratodon purpureus]|nr:hypothetical protein M758_3G118800 [Ceratodon purpureus]